MNLWKQHIFGEIIKHRGFFAKASVLILKQYSSQLVATENIAEVLAEQELPAESWLWWAKRHCL